MHFLNALLTKGLHFVESQGHRPPCSQKFQVFIAIYSNVTYQVSCKTGGKKKEIQMSQIHNNWPLLKMHRHSSLNIIILMHQSSPWGPRNSRY